MPRTLPAPVAGLVASPGLSGSTTLPALMFTVPSPRAFAVNLIEKVSAAATVAIETAVIKIQPRKARMGFTPSVPGPVERMSRSPDLFHVRSGKAASRPSRRTFPGSPGKRSRPLSSVRSGPDLGTGAPLTDDRRTRIAEDQLGLVSVVAPAAKGDVVDSSRPLQRIGLDVVNSRNVRSVHLRPVGDTKAH